MGDGFTSRTPESVSSGEYAGVTLADSLAQSIHLASEARPVEEVEHQRLMRLCSLMGYTAVPVAEDGRSKALESTRVALGLSRTGSGQGRVVIVGAGSRFWCN